MTRTPSFTKIYKKLYDLVIVRRHTIPLKILSLVVIAALLSLRLSSFSEVAFVVPVEDAIFDVAFIAAEDGATAGKPIKVKLKRAFDIIMLVQVEEPFQHGGRLHLTATCSVAVLNLKDIHSEIFIPPETVS